MDFGKKIYSFAKKWEGHADFGYLEIFTHSFFLKWAKSKTLRMDFLWSHGFAPLFDAADSQVRRVSLEIINFLQIWIYVFRIQMLVPRQFSTLKKFT